MADKKDYELFKGKTLSDLFNDIYNNSNMTKTQMTNIINQLKGYVKNIEDAAVALPLITDAFTVSVKNDEHLVKLADIIQKLLRGDGKLNADDGLVISDEDKDQILSEVEDYKVDKKKEEEKLAEVERRAEEVKRQFEEKINKKTGVS